MLTTRTTVLVLTLCDTDLSDFVLDTTKERRISGLQEEEAIGITRQVCTAVDVRSHIDLTEATFTDLGM